MPKLKINKFQGVYTNGNVANANPSVFKYFDGYIDKLGLHALKYKANEIIDLEQVITIVDEIEIDNDRKGLEYDREYKSNYIYNPIFYLMVVLDSNLILYDFVDNTIQMKYDFYFEGTYTKHINKDGVVYFYTTEKTYILTKVNRPSIQTNPEITTVNDLYLLDLYPGVNFTYNITTQITDSISNYTYCYFDWIETLWGYTVTIKNSSTNEVIDKFDLTNNSGSGDQSGGGEDYVIEGLTIATLTNPVVNFPIPSITNSQVFTDIQVQQILDTDTEGWDQWQVTKQYTLNIDNGFPKEYNRSYWIISYLDVYGNEFPLEQKELIFDNIQDYFSYVIDLTVDNPPVNTSEIRFYVKHSKDDTYQLIYQKKYYNNSIINNSVSKVDLNGIYVNQTMGVSKPEDETLVTVFNDVTSMQDTIFAIKNEKVLYPNISNGVVTNIYWESNRIPDITGQLLLNINGMLAVKSNNEIFIVSVTSQAGLFFFSLRDDMGFIVPNQYGITYSPDGIFLLTNRGIYATDGENLKLVSEPINDIVLDTYRNGKLFFLPFISELWYLDNDNGVIYNYSFVNNVWANTAEYIGNVDNVTVNRENKIYSTMKTKIIEYQLTSSEVKLLSHKVSLGDDGYLKAITHINFDFYGKIGYNDIIKESDNRIVNSIYKNIHDRKLKSFEEYEITMYKGSTIYNMEVNYNVEKKIQEVNNVR